MRVVLLFGRWVRFGCGRVIHGGLLFATRLVVWAWERAVEKQEYISYPGEWEREGVPMNVVGKLR